MAGINDRKIRTAGVTVLLGGGTNYSGRGGIWARFQRNSLGEHFLQTLLLTSWAIPEARLGPRQDTEVVVVGNQFQKKENSQEVVAVALVTQPIMAVPE